MNDTDQIYKYESLKIFFSGYNITQSEVSFSFIEVFIPNISTDRLIITKL